MFLTQYNGQYLVHHDDDVNWLENRAQKKIIQPISSMPKGIWFAFRDPMNSINTWEKYCTLHGFSLKRYKTAIQIKIPLFKRMLYIRNPYDVYHIESKYVASKDTPNIMNIDWQEVSKKYIGVILFEDAPKCLDLCGFKEYQIGSGKNWLGAWHIYSGCIWQTDLVRTYPQG